MKAWLLDSLTGLDTLRLDETADPTAGSGELVVETMYAALNPADRHLAEGQYPARPTFPHTLGRDGMGIVKQVGANVSGWSVGDKAVLLRSEVGINRPGTFAQRFVAPAESLVRCPAQWTDQQAAGATLVYLTAMQAITQWHDLPQRSVILITGASGGVGVSSLHLCKALGHTTIALSRNETKRAELLTMGASFAFDPTNDQWRQQLKDSMGDRRVDLVIDNIGGALFNDLLNVLAMNGRISCVGRLGGPVSNFNTATLFFRRIQIRGCAASTYSVAESNAVWRQIVELLAMTGDRPIIDSIFPIEDLRPAFDRLKEGPLGKVLLAVATDRS